MTIVRQLAIGTIALVSATGPAATEEIAREPDVVVIGQRNNLLTIPGSGITLDASTFDQSRPATLNDILRQAPGIFARDEEGLGLRPNIGIRGLNPVRSSKVLLLEDGIPFTFAPYGDNATYYHPSFNRYERIEVLKGASQVRFGPQTIGGVINYITPRAPETFAGRLTAAAGSHGHVDLDGTIGGPLLGGRGLVHAQSKGSDSARANQDLQFTDIFAKMEWDIADDQIVTLRASHYKEDSQVSYSGLTLAEFLADPYANPFENDRFNTERVGLAFSHAWFSDDATTVRTTLYGSHFTRDWWRQSSNSSQRPNDSSDPLCGGMANVNTTCGNEGRLRDFWVAGLETRLAHEHDLFSVPAKTEVGVRYHSEDQFRRQWNGDTPNARTPGTSVNGGVRENNVRKVDALSGFISTKIEIADLIIEPGIRAEHIEFERKNKLLSVRGKTSLSVLVPGLGVTYRLTPQTAIYAGVHKGFAPPRVEDIINNTTGGSVELDAEESVNWELGVRGTVTPGLYLDAAYFRLDFANQIIPQSVAGGVGSTLTSAGDTLHQGFELLARASAKDAGWIAGGDDIYARLAATYVMDAEFVGTRFSTVSGFGAVSVSGNRLPYAPEWLVTAALGYRFGDLASIE
ncbi:MAG TPA: TonB-dependent receptor, partial [Alphaproteobacteria bacterium]|nr:TonB-dependent receptor [Alphaproteobacteria bacterium]